MACGYQIGFGSLCGYASGLAMRKFGSIVAYTLGTGFIILQSLRTADSLAVRGVIAGKVGFEAKSCSSI